LIHEESYLHSFAGRSGRRMFEQGECRAIPG